MYKLSVLLLVLLFTSPCFAGGIGYIDYEKVALNYNFAKDSMREFEVKSSEIKQFLAQKEEEFSKIESPLQRQKFEISVRTELEAREKAFNNFREKREEEVYNRIRAVAEKIRLEKGLDILLDGRSVFSGGTDITDSLIQKLNTNNNRRK